MLAMISDSHFEEERSDRIEGEGGSSLGFSRNAPARAFWRFVATLASEAERRRAERVDLVLAGDLFDFNRTDLWFSGEERPYHFGEDGSGSAVESKALEILSAIAAEPEVAGSLEALRAFASGRYVEDGEEREFPVPTALHYITGNHDRLAGATPRLRREIRRLVGLGGKDEPFPNQILFEDPRVLVRHGHEYDRYNFALDCGGMDEIPVELPAAYYARPNLGDFITTEVAVGFPRVFREVYGDEEILADETLAAVYLRLLEFDDLRPQSALLNFLLNVGGSRLPEEEIWGLLEPVAGRILDSIRESPFLLEEMERLERKGRPDVLDAVRAFLGLRGWRFGIPLGAARLYTRHAVREETGTGPVPFAARERALRDGAVRFVVAGHTHDPRLALLASDADDERYFVDTGTWRSRIPSTPDLREFGHLRTLTYVMVYGAKEGGGSPDGTESFDYWSGFSHRTSDG
ncbi:MAG: metallophosphoesterase [Rubrobacteraceae bacterium]|nr:metallophosphoesterase [Rubrobacteraceae bacterium]